MISLEGKPDKEQSALRAGRIKPEMNSLYAEANTQYTNP